MSVYDDYDRGEKSVEVVEKVIQAYNDIRVNCLNQICEQKSIELEHRLIQTIWECDATIASLQSIINRIKH